MIGGALANDDVPIRSVAIIGGGCAGLSAAWQLSKQKNYEIHIYEKSWRLGGKCASGRAADGRVLEHGLHVWLGFYENAFRMMRECYDVVKEQEWGPTAKDSKGKLAHGRIEDALFPEAHVGSGDPSPDGSRKIWSGIFPPEEGLPGESLEEGTNPFTLTNYLLRSFGLLKTLMLSVIGPPQRDAPGEPRPNGRSTSDEMMNLDFSADAATSAPLLIERMTRILRIGSLAGAAALLQAVTMLEVWLQNLDFAPEATAVKLMEAVAAQTRKLLRDIVSIDPQIRMKTETIDILLTTAVGLFRDRVLFDDRGLDSINQYDYREWLLKHGATKTSVNSRFLSGMYGFMFAYRDGNKEQPALAAGVAIRAALRLYLTYRGSPFWRVGAGMGDSIFAPLYKVLLLPDRKVKKANKRRDVESETASPVHFHFLHKLEKVHIDVASNGKRYVKSLEFSIDGDADFLDERSAQALDDLGCWPDSPDHCFRNAVKPEEPRKLSVGKHFDGVIFATGIEDFKKACAESIQTAGRTPHSLPVKWARMCDEVKTVATKSSQVWLKKDVESLGWYRGSGLFSALDLSFDTWADMTHVLATERVWRDKSGMTAKELDEARSLAYFCDVILESEIKGLEKVRTETNDDTFVKRSLDQKVGADLTRLLTNELRSIWPKAFEAKSKASEFEIARHVEANFEGSDRYALSLPGSIIHRISPLDRSVENMTIAGDWTACGFDAGCVEAAVMSGMLAAYAISGEEPKPESIIGYDHP
jgi:uncharacterized protein with NAD-binding domain and iron-sulfur cluster